LFVDVVVDRLSFEDVEDDSDLFLEGGVYGLFE